MAEAAAQKAAAERVAAAKVAADKATAEWAAAAKAAAERTAAKAAAYKTLGEDVAAPAPPKPAPVALFECTRVEDFIADVVAPTPSRSPTPPSTTPPSPPTAPPMSTTPPRPTRSALPPTCNDGAITADRTVVADHIKPSAKAEPPIFTAYPQALVPASSLSTKATRVIDDAPRQATTGEDASTTKSTDDVESATARVSVETLADESVVFDARAFADRVVAGLTPARVRHTLLMQLERVHRAAALTDEQYWQKRVAMVLRDDTRDSERTRLEECLKILRGDDRYPSEGDLLELAKRYCVDTNHVTSKGSIGGSHVVKLAIYNSQFVVIKELPLGDALNDEARGRVRREVKLSTLVSHPNCARTIGFNISPTAYTLVIELVGPPLSTMLERCATGKCGLPGPVHLAVRPERAAGGAFVCHLDEKDGACLSTLALGRLPFELTKRYMLDVANGLRYLHSIDIAHRDLSPFNICISLDGARAVIIDFGSSKENRHANKSAHVPTMLPYASPEVLHHNSKRRANEPPRVWSRAEEIAADVFSLGMTLARCVAPRHSYWNQDGGNTADTFKLDQIMRDIDVHERLDQLLQAALHKDPSKRPRSAEFAADLRAVPHLQSLVRIMQAPLRDGRDKLPPLFRINALPNLYIRSAWPDGTEARHADVALLELRDMIAAHKAVCDKCRAISVPERLTLATLCDDDIPRLHDIVICMFACDQSTRDDARAIKSKDGTALAWMRCRRLSTVVEESALSDSKRRAFRYLNQCFWLDQFGNVISPLAVNPTTDVQSLAHADVDHVFPHSLGGRSAHTLPAVSVKGEALARYLQESNSVMLHDHANRNVKNDNVLQFTRPSLLQTGVTIGSVLDQIVSTAQNKLAPLVPLLVGFDPSETPSALKTWVANAEAYGLPALETMKRALVDLARLEKEKMDEGRAKRTKKGLEQRSVR